MRILITGGAGFVGSSLATALGRSLTGTEVCAFDNLRRRGSDPSYVVHTNLTGTVHCLEAARRSGAGVIFLSSSRVYPIPGLRALPLERRGQRFDIPADASGTGWSAR